MITMKHFPQYLAPARPPGLLAAARFVARHALAMTNHGFVCLAVVGLLASCSKKPAANVIAQVGTRQITVDDFNQEIRWRQQRAQVLPEKQALLDEMITRELRVQKAKALGLDKDADTRRRYEGFLIGKLEEQELRPQLDAAKVPAQDIQDAFQKDIARYTRPAKVRLALVVVKTDPKMSADKLAEQEARITEARKLALALPPGTQGFGTVAANFSEDQSSRYKGGDVGWFDAPLPSSASSSSSPSGSTITQPYYRWPVEVVSAGLALPNKGDISEVIKTDKGFFIVARLDSRPASVTPFEQAQPAIQHRLLAEKRQQLQLSFDQQIRTSAPIQTFTQALAKVQYPAATLARAEETAPPLLPGATLSPHAKPSPANYPPILNAN